MHGNFSQAEFFADQFESLAKLEPTESSERRFQLLCRDVVDDFLIPNGYWEVSMPEGLRDDAFKYRVLLSSVLTIEQAPAAPRLGEVSKGEDWQRLCWAAVAYFRHGESRRRLLKNENGVQLAVKLESATTSPQAETRKAEGYRQQKPTSKKEQNHSAKATSKRQSVENLAFMLQAYLQQWHEDNGNSIEKQKEIAENLDWSTSKASRAFKQLFGKGGYEAYKKAYTGKPTTGFMTKQGDDLIPEAIAYDG